MASTASPMGQRVPPSAKGYVQNLALAPSASADPSICHPFTFWFRPREVQEAVRASYQRMRPLGLPFGYGVYEGGENLEIRLDLYVHRLLLLREATARQAAPTAGGDPPRTEVTPAWLRAMTDRINQGRRYLQALLVPPALDHGLIGGAPAACLLVIPGILSGRYRLTALETTYSDQDLDGNLIELTTQCTFEEAPLQRYTMQQVLQQGSTRTWGLH